MDVKKPAHDFTVFLGHDPFYRVTVEESPNGLIADDNWGESHCRNRESHINLNDVLAVVSKLQPLQVNTPIPSA